jgi:RNA polymerase-binding transcription factor DksA
MAATKKQATKQTATRAQAKKAVAKKAPAKKSPARQAPAKKEGPAKASATAAPPKSTAATPTTTTNAQAGEELPGIPAPRGRTKDGIAYTKDFDVKFLKSQHVRLIEERDTLLGQASRLEDEANSLIEDGEMGDVQFDDESGEGDTMVVERERDLALSAQARQTIADIDAALARMSDGTYGYSVVSGRPIPRERLEAIPWATVLVEEKVGGIGRR